MQIRCSKKGCKKHEKCSKMEPKWNPESRKSQSKKRSKNRCEKGTPRTPQGRMSAGRAGAPLLDKIISSRLVFVSLSSRFRLVFASSCLLTSLDVFFSTLMSAFDVGFRLLKSVESIVVDFLRCLIISSSVFVLVRVTKCPNRLTRNRSLDR